MLYEYIATLCCISLKMPQCAAFNCTIWSHNSVAMYLFPKDPKSRRLWVHNLRLDEFVATKTVVRETFHRWPAFNTPICGQRCGYNKINWPKARSRSLTSQSLKPRRRCVENPRLPLSKLFRSMYAVHVMRKYRPNKR